jgi:hypothetical protein
MVVRAGAGEERTNNTTDVIHGEDNTGSWVSESTSANCPSLNIYRCTLAEVGAVCKAVDICLHTVDASPEEQGRGALVGLMITRAKSNGIIDLHEATIL